MLEMEVWKDISYATNYEISNTGIVRVKKTGRVRKLQIDKDGYLRIVLIVGKNKITKSIHRILGEHFIPNPNNHPIIDHIDRNKLNNTLENLRWTSPNVNCHNRDPKGNILYKGVRMTSKSTYRAEISFKGEKLHLGVFNTPEEAAKAYDEKAFEIYGEFYSPNILIK